MRLNNGEIFNLYEGLVQLISKDSWVSVKFGYYLIKNLHILEPLYSSIIQTRDKIIQDNQEENNTEKIQQLLKELSEIPNDVELTQIDLSFADASISMPATLIQKLYPLFYDDISKMNMSHVKEAETSEEKKD